MKGLRRALFVTLVLLLLAAIAAVLTGLIHRNLPQSSPKVPRKSPAYDALLHEGGFPSEFPTEPFASIRVTTNDSSLEVEISGGRPTDPPYPVKVLSSSAGERVGIGDGSLRLAHIGVGYGQATSYFNFSFEVPYKYFSPEGRPAGTEEVEAIFPAAEVRAPAEFRGVYPEVAFYWERGGLEELKVLRFDVFDEQTHWPLAQGHGTKASERGLRITTALKTWRPAPAVLALTFAAGPVSYFDLALAPGSEVHLPSGILRLVGSQAGRVNSSSTSSRGTNSLIRMGLGDPFSQSGSHEPLTTFFFLAWPTGIRLPAEIEMLDADGQALPRAGSHSSEQLLSVTVQGERPEVQKIRVKYYSQVFRLITRVPAVPGLPEENRELENLFGTRVPYLRFEAEWQFQSAVENLAQMRMRHLPLTYTNGYFPLEFTNVTAAELFLELEKWVPAGKRLVADPEKKEILLLDPPLAELWKRLQRLAGVRRRPRKLAAGGGTGGRARSPVRQVFADPHGILLGAVRRRVMGRPSQGLCFSRRLGEAFSILRLH